MTTRKTIVFIAAVWLASTPVGAVPKSQMAGTMSAGPVAGVQQLPSATMGGSLAGEQPGSLSGMRSRSITPVGARSASSSFRASQVAQPSASGSFSVFQTTGKNRGRGGIGGGFSGGAAAGGLMSSGSRYASSFSSNGGGGASISSTTPTRPRRVGKDDEIDEPFPDPETPIGDAMIPLALCACAYALARAFLKYLLYRKKQ